MHVDGSIFSPASTYRFCFLYSSSCMCVALSFSDSHKFISLLYCIVCRHTYILMSVVRKLLNQL